MLKSGFVVVLGIGAFVVAACGGDSDEAFDDNDAGSPGTGGATGGSDTGGSSGTSSSTGGKGGSATGGASGSGGSAGGAGVSGSGGSGGRGYQPPERQVMGCGQMCLLEAQAMCPNEDPIEKCVTDCRVGLFYEGCSDEWDTLFACVNTSGPATCNAAGEAAITDCATEIESAYGCILGVVTDSPLGPQCAASCSAAAEAMCPNPDPQCDFNCRAINGAFPVCTPAYETAVTCGGAAEHTCDQDGEPQPVGCNEENGAFLDCIQVDYGWPPPP